MGSVLVVELGRDQPSNDVIARVGDSLVDPFCVEITRQKFVVERTRLARFCVHPFLNVFEHTQLVLLGNTEQHAEDPHRYELRELGDEVKRIQTDELVETGSAELAHGRFDSQHGFRGEDT